MIELALAAVAAATVQDPAYESALALRRAGRAAEAAQAFEHLSASRPSDPDVWLNLGLAYTALGQYDRADQALATGLRLSPGYRDLRLAYARSAFFRGDRAEAGRRLEPLLRAAPADPEAEALGRQIAAAPEAAAPRWRIDLYGAYSRLSEDLPAWRLAGAALSRTLQDGSSVSAAIEQTERFEVQDTYLEARAGRRVGRWSGYVGLGATPDADYRPEVAVLAGATAPRLGSPTAGLEFGLEGAWRRFPVGDVRTLQPSASLYYRDAAALTVRWVNTWDERDVFRSGYIVQASFAPVPRLRLSAGWSDAPESSQGVTLDVRGTSVGAAYDIDARTAVRVDLLHEERPGYDRDEIAVALTRRF